MWRLLLLRVATALLLAGPAVAQTYPDYRDVYVNDFADLLPATEESVLRDSLISLYDRSGVEAVVVTMDTMRAYGHMGEIEPFATGLFNAWGVGDSQRNNGVMVLVARDDRQMRIELGSGYPARMDAEMQTIIDTRILPAFRDGDYAQGITDGVADLIPLLEVEAGVAEPPNLLQRLWRDVQRASAAVLATLAAAAAGVAALGLRVYQIWQRRRPRYCPADGTRMALMQEDLDDSRLQSGQTVEERLGSVDYDVWQCPTCQNVTIDAYRRWFSSYGACRSCNYRTLQGTTTVLREATTEHSGQKRIDYHCHNCGVDWSETKTIPRVSESSSSHSSFGGGSSSGGGASGRW